METLEQIKILTEELSVDATKFFKGNNSAGTRARQSAQKLKNLLQSLREDILTERKKEEK
jgi:translation elongation factor EF-4